MTEEKKRPGWGAHWLLPEEYSAAWGARAIADQLPGLKHHATHMASLLADRQSGVGENEALKKLLDWLNRRVLPIYLIYDGSSKTVSVQDEGVFHARWTPNVSYGYIYIVAWIE